MDALLGGHKSICAIIDRIINTIEAVLRINDQNSLPPLSRDADAGQV